MTFHTSVLRAAGPCLVALFQGLSPSGGYAATVPSADDLSPPSATSVYKDPHMQTTYMEYRRRLELTRVNGVIDTAAAAHFHADAPKLSLT